MDREGSCMPLTHSPTHPPTLLSSIYIHSPTHPLSSPLYLPTLGLPILVPSLALLPPAHLPRQTVQHLKDEGVEVLDLAGVDAGRALWDGG